MSENVRDRVNGKCRVMQLTQVASRPVAFTILAYSAGVASSNLARIMNLPVFLCFPVMVMPLRWC